MTTQEIQHLFWRSGFGADLKLLNSYLNLSKESLVKEILKNSNYSEINLVAKPDESTLMGGRKKGDKNSKDNGEQRKKDGIKLNLGWLDQMVNEPIGLREKTALFWHDHFACFVPLPYAMQLHVNKLRKYALGSFRELLHIISKDPAMSIFLNNSKNKKSHPNENFARELLELYTIGIGNYTENDIKEAARAFTGWSFDLDGNFVLREKQHDTDSKTFMGITKNFEGEEIIDVILDNPKTAYFITKKIYAWFVNEVVDENIVKELSEFYFKNDYQTDLLLEKIFTSNWFYEQKNIGTRIKSPVDLLVGLRRAFYLQFEEPEIQIFIQNVLGQVLGNPPNVSGWKDGKPWIDSSSLILRLKLADHIINNSEFDIIEKDLPEKDNSKGKFKKLNAKFEMNHIYKLSNMDNAEIRKTLISYFIVCNNQLFKLLPENNSTDKKTYIVDYIQRILRQPEYQLC